MRLHGWFLQLVQTGHCDLFDGIPADNYPLSWTSEHPLLAIGICLSATEVPRIAQMFGLDTSIKINMMNVRHTVPMGAKAVGLIKGKA